MSNPFATRFRRDEVKLIEAYATRHGYGNVEQALSYAVRGRIDGLPITEPETASQKISGLPWRAVCTIGQELARLVRRPSAAERQRDRQAMLYSVVLNSYLSEHELGQLMTYAINHGCRSLPAAPRHAFLAVARDEGLYSGELPLQFGF